MENPFLYFLIGLVLPFIVIPLVAFILIRIQFSKNMRSFWKNQSVDALKLAGVHPLKTMPAYPKIITEMECSQTALQVLAVAHVLGMLDLIRQNPGITTQSIAQKLRLPVRPVRACMEVLLAAEILKPLNDGFILTDIASVYFQDGSAFFDPLPLTYQAKKYVKFLKAGIVKGSINYWEKGKSHQAQNWARKQHLYSFPIGFALNQLESLKGNKKILDVAGGAGSVCVALALENPSVHLEMIELPGSLKIADKMISRYGLRDRIKLLGMDMFSKDWPDGFDAVLFTNIFHDWDDTHCQTLAQKAYDALKPGGKIYVQEALLNDDKPGPLWTAHWSLALAVITNGGQFRYKEMAKLLERSGFTNIQRSPLIGYFSCITGDKAA